mmetsp:Transcript_15929/g.23998  ORF Transcript_15929/g.23998 Transcript_15929/m.23998 type:complete len:297 (+) Transcript_15929:72-962(+)
MASSIGFIGLGIMGKGMARNLLNKLDCQLFVWNRTREVASDFAAEFSGRVTTMSSCKEVVEKCDITYCMLSTPEASVAVFDGPDGVLAGVKQGKTIIDCATLTPERMIEEEQQVISRGGRFLEAPVSGSKGPAETGTLIFLCAGGADVYEEVKPALDAMGKANFYFGAVGQGTRIKLIVNMVMGTTMAAVSEGLALSQSLDLPSDKLLEVLDLGAVACPMFKLKGPKMLSSSYDPHFPLKHAQKDMKFALQLGEKNGLDLPTTAAANKEYVDIMTEHGDSDFSAVHEQSKKRRRSS